ncbi:MAG: alpha/beta hydrolase [Caldilineaceae bacterium]|nr:alpha/beta hydrolase [Caldilineaceae bacterium]
MSAQRPTPPQPPAGVIAHRDLAYVANGHERQMLDLYLPINSAESGAAAPENNQSAESGAALANNQSAESGTALANHPLVIWVHGGAFRVGSKEGNEDNPPPFHYATQGYAVAAINYRLSQHAIWPAQIEDCKAAVRWLRAHAAEYSLDPERFAAWGPSAGGHLVAMLGVTGHVAKFEVGAHLDVSSRVQCVVDYFGPTDFLQMDAQRPPDGMIHDAPDSPESELVGGNIQEHPDKVARANPITYIPQDDITANVPPFLIVHGDQDPLVPYGQSLLLVEALEKVGADVTFYTVQGGGHGGFTDPAVPKLTAEFLAKQLAPA